MPVKRGIQYRHPWIYNFFINLIHGGMVNPTLWREVGKNGRVFDVAAGFGRMAGVIDPSNTYKGIDLNETSVKYAQQHNLDVQLGDIFDPKQYAEYDVILLIDIVHHLPEARLTEFFDLVFSHARRRVVVLEPLFNFEKRFGWMGRPIDWFLRKMDQDGVNDIPRWWSDEEYLAYFNGRFGSRPGQSFDVRIQKPDVHYIVTFTRR